MSGYVYTWRLLAATVPLFVGGVAVYSITYLLTVLAGSGEKGISFALGILVLDLSLPFVDLYFHPFAWHFLHLHIVHPSSVLSLMFAGCKWAANPIQAFPVGKLVFYGVLALASPVMAQLILERREV
jgi:hypothetical protein